MSYLPALALAWIYRGDLTLAARMVDWCEDAAVSPFLLFMLRGGLCLRRHDWAGAKPWFERAIDEDGDDALARLDLGMALFELGDFTGARDAQRAALARNVMIAKAWLKLGACHLLLRDHMDALAAYQMAVQIGDADPECHQGFATMLSALGMDDIALDEYRRARELAGGEFPDAEAGEGFTLLRLGRWAEGWPRFEARWRLPKPVATWDYRGRPLFTGSLEDMRGKRVLLRCEQGYGDTIQFARYIPLVAEVAEAVAFEVAPPLRRLFEGVSGIAELFERNGAAPAYDIQTSLMSLPLLFATTPETCPPPAEFNIEPSIAVTPRAPAASHPRVGVCWAGGPRHEDPMAHAIDIRRSLPPEAFNGLRVIAKQGGAYVLSLQYDDVVSAHCWIREGSPDWLDTADIIAGLDLVITVDTAVAHLAASLGVPTWMLCRFDSCWRWGLSGAATPWYPTMTIYRQKRLGEWAPVLARVESDLWAWLQTHFERAA